MSNVFGNLGKKISSTLENAHKDLRQSFAKSLTAAAQTIAHPTPTLTSRKAPGKKSLLFSAILQRALKMKTQLTTRTKVEGSLAATTAAAAASTTTTTEARDNGEGRLGLGERLEKEFCDLVEAYEILLSERCHLEEILGGMTSQLESLDDLELVEQYYRSLQDTAQIGKHEIARLTAENDTLRSQLQDQVSEDKSPKRLNSPQSVTLHDNQVIPPVHEPPVEISGAIELKPVQEDSSVSEESLPDDLTASQGHDCNNVTSKQTTPPPTQVDERAIVWEKERQSLVTKVAEQSQLIDSLETHKVALETKVSFLQSQIQEVEALRKKVRELSLSGSTELESVKKTSEGLRIKLELAETNLKNLKQQLTSTQAELSYLRQDREQDLQRFMTERTRHQETTRLIEQRLANAEQDSNSLQEKVITLKDINSNLKTRLADQELELVRLRRKPFNMETSLGALDGRSSLVNDESFGNSPTQIPRSSSSINTQVTDPYATSVRSLKSECERLAVENSRLRANSQVEHMRNIVLRYLQLPDQRSMLLPVIASLFRFSTEELSTIRK